MGSKILASEHQIMITQPPQKHYEKVLSNIDMLWNTFQQIRFSTMEKGKDND